MARKSRVLSRAERVPKRRARRSLFAALALSVVSTSCGGGADSSNSAPGQDPFAEIPLPADVDQQLRQVLSELSGLLCERSSRCCGMYGFAPLPDCRQLSANTLLAPLFGNIGTDDPSTFDFAIDQKMSQACLDAARSLASQCVFAHEDVLDACLAVVRITKKGAPQLECKTQSACAIERGGGYQCVDFQCLPEVEVALGADCLLQPNAADVPVCGPVAACDVASGKCIPRIATGGGCIGGAISCFDGDGCAMGKCTPKLAEGQPCDGPEACLPGLECRCNTSGCTTPICLSEPGPGGACQYPGQCTGATSCVNGICKPDALSICVLPAPR